MTKVYDAVAEKIRAQPDHEEVLALWARIWAEFESAGANGVEDVLWKTAEQDPL